ncbi:MAG: deoxyribonuclease V [Halobacteriales archaeon]|jgi:deoxyribonuclease V
MDPVRPEFVPDAALDREAMEALQREVAAAAVFEDDFAFDPDRVRTTPPGLDDAASFGGEGGDDPGDPSPIVVGVDQAFLDERAVSVVVALRGGEVIERVHAVEPLEIPYIPGLLSFREGGPILAAFRNLSVEPDLALFDGSGRIHFRQAGLATHLGVILDLPSVGVAKSLLCGRPGDSVEGLAAGVQVPIYADEDVEAVGSHSADPDALIGHAVQTRQYDSPNRHVNPLYVSPGHRVSASTAADLVLSLSAGYKLPEPTRLADADADEVKADVRSRS